MKLPSRVSLLFFIGIFAVGSTALGYYYYFVYAPPLKAAEQFMDAMESRDEHAIKQSIVISVAIDEGELREPTADEIKKLVSEPFSRGRILDQRRHSGRSRHFDYLVFREPDGRIYALVATEFNGQQRIVIPEKPMSKRHRYLWDYSWTN